jgi:putative ATPase
MAKPPDLFDFASADAALRGAPLAVRMRPRTLDEFVGQEHIVGVGKLLRRAIEADRLASLIFYGPPGSGKTTLAQIIANTTKSNFEKISAVSAGIAELRENVLKAKEQFKLYRRRTIVFIDEIHRLNKTQQDALLPAVEDGTLTLIGATTENPYFEVNRALLSRSRIFRLEALKPQHIYILLKRAAEDKEKGMAPFKPLVEEDALRLLANLSGGDARSAYNGLELAVLTTPTDKDGFRRISAAIAAESIQRQVVPYDKSGDWHYDVASAFIKSMRGSDPDAVLHWLARMLEAGETPEFIARRIIICAAEDVGLANTNALTVAVAAAEAAHYVGMPEARIPLAMAALYIAGSPKSNSAYAAIEKAALDLAASPFSGVPPHLSDASYKGAAALGHGINYKYPHDYKNAYVEQTYLPEEMKGRVYYAPQDRGEEIHILKYLARVKNNKNEK